MNRIQITKCEAEVMDAVWTQGRVTVGDVVEAIDRDLAYTTVMTTMKILEEKGIVHRGEKIGRAYTYLPSVTREQVQVGMLAELTDLLFGGSVRSLVLSLMQSDHVSKDDIEALREAAKKLESSE
ncbi:Methicillin resistance regulatory protein MecI [Rubripirellula tenax]|uniref:Methicillin resistance regulatory protein MecI n=1 Tax=Rubripirellula tenax TaxID=2528015 RepID=A0A5C6EJC4_9BACT|nr:BlaI/MecI/CopY family transcriptional regulator [Rubripirellula tenax]TWU48580.1 Methicillin resistance regulatory protein MecI [Rubripirellula tenax]